MPSDRGNGLAMRTGLLLDAYAKRYAVGFRPSSLLAAGRTSSRLSSKRGRCASSSCRLALPTRILHCLAACRTLRRGLPLLALWTPFNHRKAERRIGTHAARLHGRHLLSARACLEALSREPRRDLDAKRNAAVMPRSRLRRGRRESLSPPGAAQSKTGVATGLQHGPTPRQMRSRHLPRNGCRASISGSRPRAAKRAGWAHALEERASPSFPMSSLGARQAPLRGARVEGTARSSLSAI